jgi:hypothetical protein
MGWIAKAAGWVVAHRDAIYTGWKVFKGLRGRRKETQETGESLKDYYLRKGKKAVTESVAELSPKA